MEDYQMCREHFKRGLGLRIPSKWGYIGIESKSCSLFICFLFIICGARLIILIFLIPPLRGISHFNPMTSGSISVFKINFFSQGSSSPVVKPQRRGATSCIPCTNGYPMARPISCFSPPSMVPRMKRSARQPTRGSRWIRTRWGLSI
jgi:hypothetical protein